jgi:hypothetical protein
VSRIWDSLKDVERHQVIQTSAPPLGDLLDRRCGQRLRVCVPIFVYGHSIEREPFYEATEALYVNERGGLITLPFEVTPGQKLLLTIKKNQRDQECSVIGLRSEYLNRFAIGIAFPEPLQDFWSIAQ